MPDGHWAIVGIGEADAVDVAFEEFRKKTYSAYASYPVEAHTHFCCGWKAARKGHDALVKALEEIAATNIERETVTPVNSFRAFGQANSELIRLRDIARAALKAHAKEQV